MFFTAFVYLRPKEHFKFGAFVYIYSTLSRLEDLSKEGNIYAI
jgi:hypothetical protein